jgi:hypothetical protein
MSDDGPLEEFAAEFHTRMCHAVDLVLWKSATKLGQLFPVSYKTTSGRNGGQYIINPPGFIETADMLAEFD